MRWLVYVLLGVCAFAARAGEPPGYPILRIETGMHTAQIRRLAVDHVRGQLVTASDDKTVRVWQLPQARLVNTLRVPIDEGHEGQLFALAVSPDGKTIVTGGWTGWDWERAGSLYVFDAASGDMTRRVRGLPDAIGSLIYSRDGKVLAVGLQGQGGLQLLRASDFSKLAEDRDYRDKLLEADFDATGHFVTCALDGLVRLYAPDGKLVGRVKVQGGAKPATVRFSPDGALIAVGFVDSAQVTVIGARDLKPRYVANPASVAGQRNLGALAWSGDGRFLHAAGEFEGAGRSAVYRWPANQPDAVTRVEAARARIVELQSGPGASAFFVTEDPSIGVIDTNGARTLREPQIADFREAGASFAVSADGAVVRFPFARAGAAPRVFALNERRLSTEPPAGARLTPPLTAQPEFALRRGASQWQSELNGKPLALDDYEEVHSHAVAPDRQTLVVGTEWALRAYARDGTLRWHKRLPAAARAVNVSGDGTLALAALSDGTIRWFRLDDGGEVLALFAHANGEDWIAWTPAGYFLSSAFGDNHIGWHFNRGREREPDFFRAVQFERVLYRPDRVLAHFAARGRATTRGLVPADPVDLARIAPPRVRVQLTGSESGRAKLRLTASRTGAPMREMAVFVNNIPITPAGERALPEGSREQLTREFSVPLTSADNDIRVEIASGESLGMAERYVAASGTPASAQPGVLRVLAFGVNRFSHLPENLHLGYAAQDAEAFATALARANDGLYRKVEVRVLSDNSPAQADRAAVLTALESLREARAEDTVVVFLASHGLSDAAGNYYFFPRDASTEDVRRVQKNESAGITTLLPWTAFFDALRTTAGRRVLIVDTCQARNIEGTFDAHSLAKRSASSLFAIAMASQGAEESQEYAAGKHGLFTWALLDGLTGKADANRDQRLSLSELFAHASPLVERLRNKQIGPQTPQLVSPRPLDAAPLAGASAR